MEDERSNRKCCCCIPRNIGIKLTIVWITMAMIIIPIQIAGYKNEDAQAMYPIVLLIVIVVSVMAYVFFCKDSA